MITQRELSDYLHRYLSCDEFSDYAPNGLQIEGRPLIARVCTAVTASEQAISEAISLNADALLVHHGYFWKGEDAVLTSMKRRRVSLLLNQDINLYAYHLPLDCHSELGNNACLGRLLGVFDVKKHPIKQCRDLLWEGVLPNVMTARELSNIINQQLGRSPLCVPVSEKPISRIAWGSGAAQDFIEEASPVGVDAYLSGEISERTYYQAHELGVHYFSCGHHASERFGIRALGEHLSTHFDLKHHFIDSANPV